MGYASELTYFQCFGIYYTPQQLFMSCWYSCERIVMMVANNDLVILHVIMSGDKFQIRELHNNYDFIMLNFRLLTMSIPPQ